MVEKITIDVEGLEDKELDNFIKKWESDLDKALDFLVEDDDRIKKNLEFLEILVHKLIEKGFDISEMENNTIRFENNESKIGISKNG